MQSSLSIDDFTLLKVLGKGSYAKVLLVRKRSDNKLYALKVLKKALVEKKKQQTHVVTQRNVLVEVDHPFIIKLFYSFQTEEKLFFALQYCSGGQLFGLLAKKGRFSEEQSKFYAAQMVLALEFLHARDIIYRDLKPQNVLIDVEGYIRLTDFGLSKTSVKESNAFTMCGTPQYLAPEILYKEGHGKPVDWWCLGSILFEMVTGLPPFYCQNKNELFDKIKFGNVQMPTFISQKLKNLLEGLLQKKPEMRLGTKAAQDVKKHPWFDNVDWKKLQNKQVKPPFIPKLKSQTDTSYFDQQFTQLPPQSYSADGKLIGQQFAGFSFDANQNHQMDVEESGEVTMQIQQSSQ